jgi:error-prone DNA polymerase
VRRRTLEQLAWSGACDTLIGVGASARTGAGAPPLLGEEDRRTALWQLGMAAPGETEADGASTQLALPLELPRAPRLRSLGRWQRLIADYSTSGVTIGEHALAILRERLTVAQLATSAQLTRLPSGCDVAVAGLVIARQKPGTANGTMFLLFEDEFGTINLIVSKDIYERHRLLARTEPLLLARGRLERHQQAMPASVWQLDPARRAAAQAGDSRVVREAAAGGEKPEEIRPVINVLVHELAPLERYLPGGIEGAELGGLRTIDPARTAGQLTREQHADAALVEEEPLAADVGSSMRAVAPPVQSFASGRRR